MNNKNTDTGLTISDLWHLCAARWRWFFASVLFCLFLAVIYILRTPYLYTRYATILVREESLGNNTTDNNGKDFNQIGFVKQKNNVTDIVRHITSLDVLVEVVNRMNLPLNDNEKIDKALQIQSRLTAETEGLESNLINLTYLDSSTEKAEETLSLILQTYNDKWLKENGKMLIHRLP